MCDCVTRACACLKLILKDFGRECIQCLYLTGGCQITKGQGPGPEQGQGQYLGQGQGQGQGQGRGQGQGQGQGQEEVKGQGVNSLPSRCQVVASRWQVVGKSIESCWQVVAKTLASR